MRKTFKRTIDREDLIKKLVSTVHHFPPQDLAVIFNAVMAHNDIAAVKVSVRLDENEEPVFTTEHPIEEMQMKYIAIGPYCWGKGDTLAEAWKNCKANWPLSQKPVSKTRAKFYHAPETIYVNEMGGVSGPIEDHDSIVEVDSNGKPVAKK